MGNNIKRIVPFILLLGDLIALFLFVYIGQSDHETLDAAQPLLGSLLLVSEFALPWVLAGWLLGAFQSELAEGRAISFLARSINTWLVAAPIGILIRAFILHRDVIPTAFFIVAVGLGGLFVLGWRVLFVLAVRLAPRPISSRS